MIIHQSEQPSKIFNDFKERVKPFLDQAIMQLRKEFPNVIFTNVIECDQVYLSALITNAPLEIPDNVALGVSIGLFEGLKLVVYADVCWGDGCGSVEDVGVEPVELTEQNLESLYDHMPQLIETLRAALIRGRPSDWEGRED